MPNKDNSVITDGVLVIDDSELSDEMLVELGLKVPNKDKSENDPE